MLSILALLIVLSADSSSEVLGIKNVVKVYDGDTFYANLYGESDIFGKNIGIRLVNIDTPELTSSDSCVKAKANEAREYLDRRLRKACRVELRNISRDKYFRVDAEVYVDGVNINQEMVEKGFALPYTGIGSRPVFTCKKDPK